MDLPPENDREHGPSRPINRTHRIPEARRVIAGMDVRAPSSLSSSYHAVGGGLTAPQRSYFITVAVLFVISLLIWLAFGLGVASVFLFLLSLALLAGWLVF